MTRTHLRRLINQHQRERIDHDDICRECLTIFARSHPFQRFCNVRCRQRYWERQK